MLLCRRIIPKHPSRAFVGSAAIAALCLLLGGCSGVLGLDGWVVKGAGDVSTFAPLDSEPDWSKPPENALGGVRVELWTRDGSLKVDGIESTSNGYFDVGHVGTDPYEHGEDFLLKVSADGYKPLSVPVTLPVGEIRYGLITLVPEEEP